MFLKKNSDWERGAASKGITNENTPEINMQWRKVPITKQEVGVTVSPSYLRGYGKWIG